MEQVRQRVWCLLFAATACILAMTTARGETLPKITEHSRSDIAVKRGDRITLEVRMLGTNSEVKWVRSQETICRTLVCEMDTDDWSLGTHVVTFVATSPQSTIFLRFRVKVLTSPIGYNPIKVTVPLETLPISAERITGNDLTVRAQIGSGYIYSHHHLQVVGPLPRRLEWNEKLRTKAEAVLQFGRPGLETHVLASKSVVYLSKTASERRVAVLMKGALRSRNLASAAPIWTIMAGNWIQVDTSPDGDILVTRSPPTGTAGTNGTGDDGAAEDRDEPELTGAPSAPITDAKKLSKPAGTPLSEDSALRKNQDDVTITVLRGQARVFIRAQDQASAGPDGGQVFTLEQGFSLKTRRSATVAPVPGLGDWRQIAPLVAETSPQYLPSQDPASEGVGMTVNGDQRPKDLPAAISAASAANSRRDYFAAIEILAGFGDAAGKNEGALSALGEAYLGLYLYEQAAATLRQAIKIDPDAPKPRFLLGKLEMLTRRWARALSDLEAADDRDYEESDVLNYYLGVANFHRAKRLSARNAFTYSLWDNPDGDLVPSIRKFQTAVANDTWLDLRLSGGGVYDSNVVRSNSLDLRSVGGGLKKRADWASLGQAGFSYWLTRSSLLSDEVYFDATSLTYSEPSLKPLATVDQRLGLRLNIGLGGDDEKSQVFIFTMDTYARTIMIGGDRSMDEWGGVFQLRSPAWYNLHVGLEPILALDPLPARDDILDPVRWEVVPPGERSCHLAYLNLGATPINVDDAHLGLDIRTGGGVYRSPLHRDENFTDVIFGLSGGYAPTLRQDLGLNFSQTSRKFPNASDGRADSTRVLTFNWVLRFTPMLSHNATYSLESQGSNRTVNSYKRTLFGYMLRLDL